MVKHNKKYKKYFSYIFTYLLGLLSLYFGERIVNHINRPIISCEIKSIKIYEEVPKEWKADFNFRITNSGKSITGINFSKLLLKFDSFIEKPIELKSENFYKIYDKSSKEILLSIALPLFFDTLTFRQLPKIKKFDYYYCLVEEDIDIVNTIDSSDIRFTFGFGLEYRDYKDL